MNDIILSKKFFDNIPDNSYILILKPPKGRDWFVTVKTDDMKRVRATSLGKDLQECFDELSNANMEISPMNIIPIETKDPETKRVNDILRKFWNKLKDDGELVVKPSDDT